MTVSQGLMTRYRGSPMVVTNSFPFGQTLIHDRVEFFQAGNAVDVVDGNPRQPGTVSAYASYPWSHPPVFLLPAIKFLAQSLYLEQHLNIMWLV
jgi:hypothetical protein